MTSSVSFRITRTAEDLAQTITALTTRLVQLEQRQQALELQLRQQLQLLTKVGAEESAKLDGIESLLQETRALLQLSEVSGDDCSSEEHPSDLQQQPGSWSADEIQAA